MNVQDQYDQRALRRCFGQFGTGVTVITTRNGASRAGVTANSFTSLSLDPPMILWSIKRTSRSFDSFMAAQHFAVNVLSDDQIDISQTFAGPAEDKFGELDLPDGKTGSPVVPGAIAVIECGVDAIHDGGDHVIIVGRVVHFTQSSGNALLFSQGRYAVAAEHPKLRPAIDMAKPGDSSDDDPGLSFWRLMFLAQNRMSRRFDRFREQEGLKPEQTRVLNYVYETQGCTLDRLVEEAFLSRRVCEDTVAILIERNYVVREAGGVLKLTEAGIERRQVIAARWAAFESEQLEGSSPEDIDRARRVIERILARTDAN